jgi:hypothetical protein
MEIGRSVGDAMPSGVRSGPRSAPPAFALPAFQLSAFGLSAGGWSSDNTYPRELADVSGDGKADIVGFSSARVYESLAIICLGSSGLTAKLGSEFWSLSALSPFGIISTMLSLTVATTHSFGRSG